MALQLRLQGFFMGCAWWRVKKTVKVGRSRGVRGFLVLGGFGTAAVGLLRGKDVVEKGCCGERGWLGIK